MVAAPGLIFTVEHVQTAHKHRDIAPFNAAWADFERLHSTAEISSTPLNTAIRNALRWRLLSDEGAAGRAIDALSDLQYSSADADVESFARAFATAQAIACISDHPAATAPLRARIIDAWQASTAEMQAGEAIHLRAWAALVGLCAGILLDQPEQAEMAAAQFRALVDLVQPHGYVAALVGEKDGRTLARTLQFVQALVLAAETGAHHGFDLWGYERRGVSVMTAALYPLYYFFYPEKWPWDANRIEEPVKLSRRARRERARLPMSDLTPETARPLFVEHGSFLELVNHRAIQPIRAVTMVLEDLRPINNLLGGGPVTLTHAKPAAPKRLGFFGRKS